MTAAPAERLASGLPTRRTGAPPIRLSRRRHFVYACAADGSRPGCSLGLPTYDKPCVGILRALTTCWFIRHGASKMAMHP
jgi:hypothetical protein